MSLFSDTAIIYDHKQICDPVTFKVEREERVIIDGKNGSGKSSLLKLLLKYPIGDTGKVEIGSGVIISYVPQDTSYLEGTLTKFADQYKLEESLFKAVLRKMDFERIQFEKDMRENFQKVRRKKVLLAKSLCESAHLYVWDEPLNYIDVYSRMRMERVRSKNLPPRCCWLSMMSLSEIRSRRRL